MNAARTRPQCSNTQVIHRLAPARWCCVRVRQVGLQSFEHLSATERIIIFSLRRATRVITNEAAVVAAVQADDTLRQTVHFVNFAKCDPTHFPLVTHSSVSSQHPSKPLHARLHAMDRFIECAWQYLSPHPWPHAALLAGSHFVSSYISFCAPQPSLECTDKASCGPR